MRMVYGIVEEFLVKWTWGSLGQSVPRLASRSQLT